MAYALLAVFLIAFMAARRYPVFPVQAVTAVLCVFAADFALFYLICRNADFAAIFAVIIMIGQLRMAGGARTRTRVSGIGFWV